MSSRSTILNAVREAQGATATGPLPESSFEATVSLTDFIATLDLIGARVMRRATLNDAKTWMQANVPADAPIASVLPGLSGTIDLHTLSDPHQQDGIHTAIFHARFGVCENGSVWMAERNSAPTACCR